MFQGSTSIKHFKRLKVYKNSTNTVSFDPDTKRGYSYNWNFVGVVNGVLLFNEYTWSVTTSGHQSAMRGLMRELGLKPLYGDFGRVGVDRVPGNMKQFFKSIIELEIKAEMTRAGTFKRGCLERNAKQQRETFDALLNAGFKLSLKDQIRIRNEAFEAAYDEVNENEYCRACKVLDFKAAQTDFSETVIE